MEYLDQVPNVMFTFVFNANLDEEDITDIWQNLPPKIALNPKVVDSKYVSHMLDVDPKLKILDIKEEIYWHVFKVKMRAKNSYLEKIRDSINAESSDNLFGRAVSSAAQKRLSAAEEEKYSYNWPYDFCSLVELGKLSSKIGFRDMAPAPTPGGDPPYEELRRPFVPPEDPVTGWSPRTPGLAGLAYISDEGEE